ncbi:MAG TPA: helix-turn-helix transcriptional regulator [Gemmatimonadales bacterium]|nr:helix-turn-helix transcriptional regulator [Gemmatimonadales bacterium]
MHGTEAAERRRSTVALAAALRRDNRQLLAELRGHVDELRVQQARFQTILTPGVAAVAVAHPDVVWDRFGLTDREKEVARLLAKGRRNAAIAAALGISPHTARHHTQRVLAKLGVHSRAEAGARLRG